MNQSALLAILFFISGAAALIYQVLWVRELGLLFGSTAEAAALTIAIFFAGIALGGWFWGSRAGRTPRPLRTFGLVEIGVAVTALGHFLVADIYFAIYPTLYAAMGASPVFETLVKALVAATILMPSAFLMGGTLPLMGQHVVRAREELGRQGSRLYAINTAGGATGALVAGFVLPMALGYSGAYLLAVGMDLAVGISAILLARRVLPMAAPERRPASAVRLPFLVWTVAFLSGVVTLAVEVIWTRLFSQVLQNSVYTYSLVLATFLAALALGAALANWLARQQAFRPGLVLTLLLLGTALVAAGTPWLFHAVTGGLGYLGRGQDFLGYVLAVFEAAAIVMLLPGIVLGAVLPYLLRLMQSEGAAPGEVLGRLIAVNTAGAILGALAAGFALLPLFGSWQALQLLAAIYLVLGAATLVMMGETRLYLRAPATAFMLLAALFVATVPPDLETIRINTARGESLVEMREGRAAHAAVIERNGNLAIRVNNYYTLGGSGAMIAERNQTLIPLLAHPEPRELFFLGMGTGITAGAALFLDPERVAVCEILPDVVELAEKHFGPYTNGLFEDERVTIHAEDGRHCLARDPARYDAIIADLFTPWKAGTGNLYTLDHYRMAASRLKPGGIYVQWVPLYQVSAAELSIITRTMMEVFPQLTFWRGDLYPERSILALVGSMDEVPLDMAVLRENARATSMNPERPDAYFEAMGLKFYAGNAASGLFSDAALNTDDYPLIEYQAPRTHRAVLTGRAQWVTGLERDRLYGELHDLLPPASDPYLAGLDQTQLGYVDAGRIYAAYRGQHHRNENQAASESWQAFTGLTPPFARRPDSPAGQVGSGMTLFGLSED
ncbi:MAG: fused MFS/spermidine synthase [Rhizobiaceae bacterium]